MGGKNIYVEGLVADSKCKDYFMLKSVSIKEDKKNNHYIDIILGDRTGNVSAKKWNASEDDIEFFERIGNNAIIQIKAEVNSYKGSKQLKITDYWQSTEEDGLDLNDFYKVAPEPAEDMYDEIMDYAGQISDEELKKLCLTLMERNQKKIMYWPAASKNHHAEMAGLLYHMVRMLRMGVKACQVYDILDKDWVVTGVIIHDMEKINEILSDEWGVSPGYSFEGKLLGHIAQGVKLIDRLARELGIGEEKAVMLEHMILSHHYEPEYGSPKRPMFPEAELLHFLDNMDARLFDMEDVLKPVAPGEFSEKVWTLENRMVYKPTFKK